MADKSYNDIIGTAVAAAAGLGACTAFFPGADIAGVSATWVTMMVAISSRSNHELDSAFCAKIAASVAAGAAGYWAGSKVFTGILFYVVPGAGSLTASTINSVLNGLYTWRLGTAFAHLFNKPGFDLADARNVTSHLVGAMKPIPTMSEVRRVWDLVKS